MPKVSICIPAYGNPEGIRRLLDSIKEQTFTDYEVVLTDDSPDDSVRDAALESDMECLRYHKNEKRLGATGNWNEAVRRAKGEYIKIMHHDDWFSQPDSLERFVALLDGAPEAALAFCGSWQVTLKQPGADAAQGDGPDRADVDAVQKDNRDCADADAVQNGSRDGANADAGCNAENRWAQTDRFARCISDENEALLREDWRNLFLGNYIGAPSATIYRKNDQEYEPKLTWVMDMEYYMRLLEKKPEIVCTKDPLVCIGVSGDQLTEKCREDGRLNIFEYGFLFLEFKLAEQKRYRERLIGVALEFKQPYSALEPYGIPKAEYDAALRKKKKEDLHFLLGVVKRKLSGKR